MNTETPAASKAFRARRWLLKILLGLIILAPLWFMIAALGYKWGWWDLGFSFGTMTRNIGPKLLMGTAFLGLIGLVLAFIVQPRKGFVVSLLAIMVPVLGLGHASKIRAKAQNLPFIHDITTDTQNPPMFTEAIMSERNQVEGVNTVDYIGKMDPLGKELVSVLQSKGYPDISSLVLSDSPDVAFGEAKSAAKTLGWDIKSENVDAGILEATETTFWYGFEDDIIIRIAPSEGGGSVVDIRSISRIGGSDIGANAARIREFLEIMRR